LDIRHGKYDAKRLNSLPAPIQRVLKRALAPDRSDRYPDVEAFRAELLASLDEDTLPMSDGQLTEFMKEVFAADIRKERETENEAELQVLAATPTAAGRPTTALSSSANPLNVFSGQEGHPLSLNLPNGQQIRIAVQTVPADEPTPDLDGDLLHASVPRLLHRLVEDRESGRLDLHRDPVRKTLFLENGNPTFAVSNVEREFFGEYLVARGVLTREQHAATLDLAAKKGLRFMEATLEQQLLQPNQIYRYLADQIRDRILELFSWIGGTYAFFRGQEAPEPGMPLNLRTHTLIHEGVQERVPLVVIRRALEGVLRHRVVRTGGELPGDLQISGRQLRLLRTIEEEQLSAEQLIKREKDEEQILRLLYMLHQIERLEFREEEPVS